ncbi:glucose dehydrogenase [Mytilinidion resinicola]|uniref:Glucose dehydrogenase n=1 Tax=Mytilinidion resinicola TaxID=574789 RepID=A0A6A6Y6X1_9PEZI|nr:glucose dehydrogenase [Mytilinidion resinicola]KAF2804349.1 glucose dehydrogenase [Mytilinidion resinicola]
MLANLWDVIVVGGGLAGSVISSRLLQNNTSLKILLIEAGEDVSTNTIIPYADNQALLVPSPWSWNDTTVPQTGLDNRVIPNPAGKGLGGGTIINSCGWIRGNENDFDLWASTVGDSKWSYNGQLPYFRKVEHTWNASANPEEHGFVGPMWFASVSSTGRNYPLRNTIKSAWAEAGLLPPADGDANDGTPLGLGELNENRKNGLRELASSAYPLAGVTVLTNTLVGKILISQVAGSLFATGVKLANGTEFYAKKQVILSAGAYRTPQLLKLSGVGPTAELNEFGIKQLVNAPAVGTGLADHMLLTLYWKLRPEVAAQGVALGSTNPLFAEPQFGDGVPADWVATESLPTDQLIAAITKDEGKVPSSSHPLLATKRSFMETLIIYAGASAADPVIQYNGSHIISTMVGLLPTSRGTVKLASTNPADHPIIDPQYFTTEVDKLNFRHGIQRVAQLFLGTPTGNATIEGETPADGFAPITLSSDDDYLNARARHSSENSYHPMGTAAMGKVVDNNLNVIGVKNLKIADTSVFPVVITAHLQQATYAMAEQAAVIIAAACKN